MEGRRIGWEKSPLPFAAFPGSKAACARSHRLHAACKCVAPGVLGVGAMYRLHSMDSPCRRSLRAKQPGRLLTAARRGWVRFTRVVTRDACRHIYLHSTHVVSSGFVRVFDPLPPAIVCSLAAPRCFKLYYPHTPWAWGGWQAHNGFVCPTCSETPARNGEGHPAFHGTLSHVPRPQCRHHDPASRLTIDGLDCSMENGHTKQH